MRHEEEEEKRSGEGKEKEIKVLPTQSQALENNARPLLSAIPQYDLSRSTLRPYTDMQVCTTSTPFSGRAYHAPHTMHKKIKWHPADINKTSAL